MFVWPPGIQQRTKILISQILWTLWLDFEGVIEDSKDAPKELINALRAHGVDKAPDMTLRLMLPHIAGGKYGTYIERTTLDNRRTSGLRLISDLPDESHLPDSAGTPDTVDSIDAQLFGTLSVPVMTPARGDTRDSTRKIQPTEPVPGTTGDDDNEASARGSARDDHLVDAIEPARRSARDEHMMDQPAPGPAGDQESNPAPGSTGDQDELSQLVAVTPAGNEFDAQIALLDAQAGELLEPTAGPLGPRDLLGSIHDLIGTLEAQLSATVTAVDGPDTSVEHAKLLEEKGALVEQLGRYLRRIKDAEARLVERNKENDGLKLQLKSLQTQFDRLEANMEIIKKGERAAGTHLRNTERFISERPHERRGGDTSKLVYSVG